MQDTELAAVEQAGSDDCDDFELWPDNRPAFELFLAAITQMRLNDFTGVPIGLDYVGLEATARLKGVALTPALFEDIQIIELGYVRERRKIMEEARQ